MSALWQQMAALDPPPLDGRSVVRFGRRIGRRSALPRGTRALTAAAVLATLSAGILLGRTTSEGDRHAAPDLGGEFMFVLRGDAEEAGVSRDRLVQEYSSWAAELAEEGKLIIGAELEPEGGRWVAAADPAGPADAPISGFFLVRADSYEGAAAIARSSAHLSYGGVIEVRRLSECREP